MKDIVRNLGSKNTLIVGGAGFIGTHLVSLLKATGREVTVLGRRSKPTYSNPMDCEYVQGDYRQVDLIRNLVDAHDEIIHLAYATPPNTSFDSPFADLCDNLEPSINLFIEIAQRNKKLFLVSSGGTVYGQAKKLPISEDHPTLPISSYGLTKLAIENYARLISITHGLKYVCIRPSNAYGIGQIPFSGQGFVSTAIASAICGKPIFIYGQVGCIRDYINVADLARGIISVIISGKLYETYNIGSGIGMSNMEVLQYIKPHLLEVGFNLNLEIKPERKFDVIENVLDICKINRDTGWAPTISFHEGVTATRDWLMSYL